MIPTSFRPPIAWLGLALLAGCTNAQFALVSGELAADSESLAFPTTYLGYPTERTLTLRNLGRAPMECAVGASAPFAATPAASLLAGAGELALRFTFDPRKVGPAESQAAIRCDDEWLDVPLSGLAARTPPCPPSTACREIQFDPGRGECVASNREDGAACPGADQCVVDGRCIAGECIGAGRDCDDANACTRDACEPGAGCVHLELTSSCPSPADPCRVAACDPRAGCTTAPAVDGTLCGEADCRTADVCLLGQCRNVPVPDGALCAPATPCSGEGFCHNQVCEIPAPQPMQPLWTWPAPLNGKLTYPGTVDLAGHVYLLESAPGPDCLAEATNCRAEAASEVFWLVSLTRDGYLRYRTEVPWTWAWHAAELIALDPEHDRVFVTNGMDGITAFRMSDGAALWSKWLGSELADPSIPEPQSPQLLMPTVLSGGELAFSIQLGEQAHSSWTFVLRGEEGAVLVRQLRPGHLYGFAADESGGFYFGSYGCWASEGEVLSLSAAGATRWSSRAGGQPRALAGGHLLTSSPTRLLDAVTGEVGPAWGDNLSWITPAPLMGGGVVLDWVPSEGPMVANTRLRALSLTDGAPMWSVILPGMVNGEGQLTSRGTAILATTELDGCFPAQRSRLHEVSLTGRALNSCELPGHTSERFGLARDRAYLLIDGELQAFAAPGWLPATSGWTADGGSPLRNRRPR